MKRRLDDFFNKENADAFSIPEITIEPDDAPLNHFLIEYKPNIEEYTILLLALFPHIQPNFLDAVIQQYLPAGGDFVVGEVRGDARFRLLPVLVVVGQDQGLRRVGERLG